MNKVFIDTDIVLDVLTAREPHYPYSARLFSLIESGNVRGYVSPLLFSNLHYVLRRSKPRAETIDHLRKLKFIVGILPIDEKVIDLALSSDFEDFEDAVQYYTALQNKMDFIITRNKKDYRRSKLPVYTAEEFIKVHR